MLRADRNLATAAIVAATTAGLAALLAAGDAKRPAGEPLPPARDAAYRIDVNSCDERWLQVLPGIGPSRAGAIVRERERSGPFRSLDDLTRVPGIGPSTIEGLHERASCSRDENR